MKRILALPRTEIYKCAVCLCALFFLCGHVYASDSVLILKSGNMLIVNEAADAFRSAWRGDVDVYTVKSSSETINTAYYTAAVAIGSKASVVLKSNHEEGMPALYGLVLSPDDIGMFSNKFIGISPVPDFNAMLSDLRSHSGGIRTVGVIYSGRSEYLFEALNQAADKHNITIVARKISGRHEIAGALENLRNIDLFYLMPDPILLNEKDMTQIMKFFNKLYVPTVAAYRIALTFGASYAYVLDPADIGSALAAEASRALKDSSYRPRIIYARGRLYKR